MVIFNSASLYIASKTTLNQKIQAVEALIDALDDVQLDAVTNENKSMYILDDGQTKVQVNYRGGKAMEEYRFLLEQRLQRYINKLNGRSFRAIDGHSINRPNLLNGGR
jgi:hypothetical protein